MPARGMMLMAARGAVFMSTRGAVVACVRRVYGGYVECVRCGGCVESMCERRVKGA